MNKKNMKQQGQVMVITVLVLSATTLASATIASMLTLNQLRQARGITDSARAIYAADTGIEHGVYVKLINPAYPAPTMTNGPNISFTVTTPDGSTIRSLGQAGNSQRAFSLSL